MDSALFYCETEEFNCFNRQQVSDHDHFLESCFLCQKPLALNHDIYMYRGNAAFCSNECRQEQIEMDEGKERRRVRRKTGSSAKKTTSARSTVAGAVSVA